MSIGLSNALATFMDLMNMVCRLMLDQSVIVFINDIWSIQRPRSRQAICKGGIGDTEGGKALC